MKVITRLSAMKKERRPVVLAAGFFDGVHAGHRRVIDRTVAESKRIKGVAWVLTFDKHPKKVLKPESAPLLLTSNRHKLRLIKKLKVDGCIVLPFTRQLAGLAPETFVRMLSDSIPELTRIFVGKNWRFGHGEKGDVGQLAKLARDFSIRVSAVRPVLRSGRTVSSTRIRKEVLRGNLAAAAGMLGRPFSILGVVVKGRAVGRRMGYPTANLETFNEVLPPYGVYAVRAEVGGCVFGGVVNIGTRPTFRQPAARKAVIEVHLFGLHRNIYGREVEVFFVKKLRSERRFSLVENLRKQIERDVRNARKIL